MPLRIVTADGKTFRFRDYELPPLGPCDLRVRVEMASPKHGTELHLIEGSVFDRKRWDPELRLFLPRPEESAARSERGIGNIVVGTVTAAGPAAARFRPGDRVFGYGPVCEEHQAPEERWTSMAGLADADALCTDPAHVALVAVRDGKVRIGDAVAVFGLGAIGLLAVQIARAGGARRVLAIDPISPRRAHAEAHGADLSLDPYEGDTALRIKEATGRCGVDVAIETSGSAHALQEAIRCVRQCGTVVHVPWGPKDASALRFDEEFHLNRVNLIGSQAVWQNPDRDHPLWNEERARSTIVDLFRDGLITGRGIVNPVVPFRSGPEVLPSLLARPEKTIKIGVRM